MSKAIARIVIVLLLLCSARGSAVGCEPVSLLTSSTAVQYYILLVECLTAAHRDIDAWDMTGQTALHHAACANNLDRVRTLVHAGANVNARNMFGNTPLLCAISGHHYDVVAFLLSHDADIHAKNMLRSTPLCCAVSSDYTDLVALMLKNRRAPLEEGLKASLLETAQWHYHAEMVRVLLDHQPVSITDERTLDWEPIHSAAFHGRVEEAREIIESTYNVFPRSDFLRVCPIYYAIYRGHVDIVEMILKTVDDATCYCPDDSDQTALHIAAQKGHLLIVQWLLEKKANMNALNGEKQTAIYLAALHGHADVVDVLRRNGADMTSIMNNHGSILHRMMSLKHYDLVRMFVELGARTERDKTRGCSLLYLATLAGQCAVVNALIERSDNVAELTSSGKTLLHIAASEGHYNLVRMLLTQGIDVNVTDNVNRTPMHDAARHGHINVLELLRRSGGNLLAGNVNKMTPAVFAAQHGHFDVLAYIFAHSSDHNPFVPIDNAHVSQRDQDDQLLKAESSMYGDILSCLAWIFEAMEM